jgi:hypothetical protein
MTLSAKVPRGNFDVFLTVHHSIEFFHLPTLMYNSLFINNMYVTLLSSTTILEQTEEQSARNRCTVQPFTETDDTRCCENTTGPPEDGLVNARNM